MGNHYKKALIKADEIRESLGLDMFEPINIYDACIDLGLTVRFVDINMEGMYIKPENKDNAVILLSNQRPFPRRVFTCAHELGHHIFNHGSKIDGLSDENAQNSSDSEEFLVDCFAGSLLMPIAGIKAEFSKRKLIINESSPAEFFTISSVFGVGYQTLITHCKANSLLNTSKALELAKTSPKKIFKRFFSDDTAISYFKIIDRQPKKAVIDLEVSNYIILPKHAIIKGELLKKITETSLGVGFLALKPGLAQVYTDDGNFNSMIRIQNRQYIGLAQYRHLENTTNNEQFTNFD